MLSQALSPDSWLESMLGKPAWHHAGDRRPQLEDLPGANVFVDAKISVNDLAIQEGFLSSGFRLVDTVVQFRRSQSLVGLHGVKDSGNSVRMAVADDEGAVRSIARKAFTYDRFHADPEIPSETANRIKESWAGNFFSGSRGNWMVVGQHEGIVSGFLQLLKGQDEDLVIDLIAVDHRARGLGLARSMITFASENCAPDVDIIVGTQLANVASISLYESMGFRFKSASHVFHLHR